MSTPIQYNLSLLLRLICGNIVSARCADDLHAQYDTESDRRSWLYECALNDDKALETLVRFRFKMYGVQYKNDIASEFSPSLIPRSKIELQTRSKNLCQSFTKVYCSDLREEFVKMCLALKSLDLPVFIPLMIFKQYLQCSKFACAQKYAPNLEVQRKISQMIKDA